MAAELTKNNTQNDTYAAVTRAVAVQKKAQNKRDNQLYHGQILLQEGPITDFPAAERFRMLRAKLERQNRGKNNYRLIGITSAVPKEGKSVTSVNLARALSIDPLGKTLLIDCDMRKPAAHQFFSLNQGPGLSDILVSKTSPQTVIHHVSRCLDVLTAGTTIADPTQAIEEPEFPLLLNTFKKQYRYVIIDCPPTLLCPEPIAISSIVDTILLVVRAWRTEKHCVEEAVETVGRSRILGIVINDIKDASRVYDYYGYYGYTASG